MIKYFWTLEANRDLSIDHKLLPAGNIDLILNLSDPISYVFPDAGETTPRGFHFSGISDRNIYRLHALTVHRR